MIFALGITVLFGAAGLAFDVGRFYSERRFLQNAADAARPLGRELADPRREHEPGRRHALARSSTANFSHSPSGVRPAMPPTTPVYETGHAGDPEYLINGILISGGEVRVAVQNTVGYTFGRIIGLDQNAIGAQARATDRGNMLPIAVRRYVNLPGPTSGAAAPCPGDQRVFTDFFATANTACLGSETTRRSGSTRPRATPSTRANPGSDPVAHGPVVAILGQGAQPSNGADFRGFIALDIRNYAGVGTQLYYNNVTAVDQLQHAQGDGGELGHGRRLSRARSSPPPSPRPIPNNQVATMSGNSTGIVIDEILNRFVPGEEVLIAVYPGNVMAIPDFTITPPSTIALPTTGVTLGAGSMKVSCNQQFPGSQVTLSTLADLRRRRTTRSRPAR